MDRAALAWVASASSSSGGANSEAKKIVSQSPSRMAMAVERRGLSLREAVGDAVSDTGKVGLAMILMCCSKHKLVARIQVD